MNRKYIKLKDLFEVIAPLKQYVYTGIPEEHAIKNLVQAFYPALTNSLLDTEEADTLWCQYIVPQNYDMACFFVDNADPGTEFYENDWRDWFRRFGSIYFRTYAKYKQLIDIYEANLDNLMADVKTTSESKFNDTPQNIQGQSYDWSDDDHLSNITRSESSTELGSKMSRIAEIQDNLRNLYANWANEFRGIFIYE